MTLFEAKKLLTENGLAFEISDPDGHSFEVEYKPGSDADVLNRQVGSYSVVITGKSAPEGSYTGKIMVKDQYGMSAEYNVPYVIKSNQAPEILKEIDDVILPSKNEEFRISLSEYFSDGRITSSISLRISGAWLLLIT